MNAPSSGGGRFARTADIRAAIKGREPDLLDALNIPWRDGKPHLSCPYASHADNNPSWRWDQGKARAYCTCHTGGHSALDVLMHIEGINFEAAKIRTAELLNRTDLIRERRARKRRGAGVKPPDQHRNGAMPPAGCTLPAYAEAKGLPIEFLRRVGLSEISYQGLPAVKIPYFVEDGAEGAVRFRLALSGGDRFRWREGSKLRLYGVNRIAKARDAGYVVLVEGESDCQTLWYHDIPAIGLPGAGNWNEQRDAPLFDEIATIYLVIEPDQGGETALRWLAKSRIRDRVRLVRVDGVKDANNLYLDNPQLFPERWQAALDVAEPLDAIADRKAAAEAQQAQDAARDLILDPNILSRFAVEMSVPGSPARRGM